jgi:flagellar motor protein MotB
VSHRNPHHLFPALLATLALHGCATTLPQGAQLSATRAALEAQMEETARLEREVAGMREANSHEPPAPEAVPKDVPVVDPAGQVEVAKAPAAAPVEEFAPVEEEVEVELVEAVDPWAELEGAVSGARASSDTLLVTASLDRIARAIEQQTLIELMEARLEDKQRQIDALAGTSGSGSTLTRQVEQLSSGQTAANARLAEVEKARQAEADAKKAAEAQVAAEEAKKAADAKAAEEQARWDALQMRLDAIEKARGAPAATPAPVEKQATGPTDASAAKATDARTTKSDAQKAQEAEAKAARERRAKAQDPRVEELQRQLDAAQAAAAAREAEAAREASTQEARHAQEREEALQSMEARYAELARQQAKALDALEEERRKQDRWWRKLAGGSEKNSESADKAAADQAAIQARLDAAKAQSDADWKVMLARQDAEREAAAVQAQAAAEERTRMEAQIAAMSARLDAVDGKPTADPAQQAQIAALAASVDSLTAERDGLQDRLQGLEARESAKARRLEAKLAPIVAAGIAVEVDGDRARIKLPSDVLFTSGASTLAPSGNAAVDQVSKTLVGIPGLRLQVEGHTDNVPIAGGKRTNFDLGFARASSVMARMTANGLPAASVSAASYGDTRPVASNATAEGRAQNRRIDIVVLLED